MKRFGIPLVAAALATLVGLGLAAPSTAQADSGWFYRADRNGDGFISKRERALAFNRWQNQRYWNGWRWVTPQHRYAHRYRHNGRPYHWNNARRIYRWADRNRDGRLGPREQRRANRVFNWADRNNDGRIGPRERKRARNAFDRADRNDNGRISRREWRGSRQVFNWADRNNNGRIGPRERERAQNIFRRESRAGDDIVRSRDRNRDGRRDRRNNRGRDN